MTSRERILQVLKGKIPDRVPVTLFIMDEGHFLNQIYPGIGTKDITGNKLKVIDLQRKFGADIHIRMWGGCVPLWLMMGGFNTDSNTKNWKVESIEKTRGKSRVTESKVTTPKGELFQEFTISEFVKGTLNYACTKKPVKSIKDIDILEKYKFGKSQDSTRIASNQFDYILDCDLLIIDDLGTELNNSFTASQLYLIINERLLRQKSTIISTNLSLTILNTNYSERIYSRIISKYKVRRIIGEDIRLHKAVSNS